MQITYKFQLYPTKEQEKKLLWALEKCRLAYNWLLEELDKQENPNKLELQFMLPKFKEQAPSLKQEVLAIARDSLRLCKLSLL
jgi:transposase